VACRLGRRPIPLSTPYLRYYATCGLLGSALPTSNMFLVVQHIPAGLMAVVIATAPLLTYLFALLFRVEVLSLARAAGIGLGFAGSLLIVVPERSLPDPALAPWVALAFLTPALYALNSVYAARKAPAGSDSLTLAAGMLMGAGVLLAPAVVVSGSFFPLWSAAALDAGLVLLHLFGAALAFVLFFVLLRLSGPVYFSQVAYLVTLWGVGLGMLFLGERHSPWVWLSLVLIFAGLALVNRRDRPASA
jgi:drug/metabolite transporter (DMT)-like permease